MTDDPQRNWRRLTGEYLQQVDKALEQAGHPRRGEVLEDVNARLDRLYEELSMDERTPQQTEAVIQEMGKPAEYAKMLTPDENVSTWSSLWRRRYLRLAAGLLLVVVVVPAVLVWPFEALPVLSVALYASVLAAIAVGYIRTRNGGLIWLGIALFIWPLAWTLLTHTVIRPGLEQVSTGEPTGIFPFTLVERGQMTLGSLLVVMSYVQQIGRYALMLVAVLKLAASRGRQRERQRPAGSTGPHHGDCRAAGGV